MTRDVVLAVNVDTIPQVITLLRQENITLGSVTVKEGELRCATVTGPQPSIKLSRRDLTILHAFADGLTHHAIGEILGLAGDYVKGYCTKELYPRLGASGRCEAVAIAYRMGALNSWEAA